MAHISVRGVSIIFPIIGAESRSLKRELARRAIGGIIGSDRSGRHMVGALNNVYLELNDGDRLGLVGPNGSGKTTLLRCLVGGYQPDVGEIDIGGKVSSLLDLSIGIDPTATGYDNIYLRGLVAGLTSAEIKERTAEIAEFSGLGNFLSLPMRSYSAGMQARLAFAVATSVDADILLMDEWIAVGDAEFQAAAHTRLTGLVGRSKILVLASHSDAMITTICNKVMVMQHGKASKLMTVDEYKAMDRGLN